VTIIYFVSVVLIVLQVADLDVLGKKSQEEVDHTIGMTGTAVMETSYQIA
jgi:hypothetical protein